MSIASSRRAVDAIALVCFLLGVLALFAFTADDAFIVLRYATNLVAGHGLVFNRGEPVCALTSPLHGLLMSALAVVAAPSHLELANKCLACVTLAATGIFAGRALFPDNEQRALFYVLSLFSPFVLLWTVGGLETPYLSALVLSAFVAYVKIVSPRCESVRGLLLTFHGLCGLALVCRADSAVFLLPLLVHVAIRFRRARLLYIGWVMLVVSVAAWAAFATYYYGNPIPTSAYYKLGVKTTAFLDNLGYSSEFLLFSGLGLLVLLFAIKRFATSQANDRHLPSGVAWVSGVLLFMYSLTQSAQHMFFGFRFFAPYVPVLMAVCVERLRLQQRHVQWLILALVIGQVGLVFQMQQFGVNVTVTGAFAHTNSREYDDVSLDQYSKFIEELKQPAVSIAKHWELQHRSDQPRLAVYSGGVPPFLLPKFYVLESLVSYRRKCHPDFFLQGHYVQFLIIGPPDKQRLQSLLEDVERRHAGPTEVVYLGKFQFANGTFPHIVLFVPKPRPLSLPPRIGDDCPLVADGVEPGASVPAHRLADQ